MTAILVKSAPTPIASPASKAEEDTLLSLIAKAKARKPYLAAQWKSDENAQLHCQWVIEK